MPTSWDYDCAVIGGGPGGLTSALYLKRFRRGTVVIHSGKPRAAWIPRTYNLLGYDRGISGKDLLRKLGSQVDRLGLEKIRAEAEVHRIPKGFRVNLGGDQRSLTARTVILATGFRDVEPEVENVPELREKGLLRYCSICDGYEYRDSPVAVLAKNDLGIQKALFLSHWTKDLRLILPHDYKVPAARMHEMRKIRAKLSRCRYMTMKACKRPKGLEICLDNLHPVFARVAYVELGCTVNESAFRSLRGLQRTQDGFITTTSEQRTNIPGLFAVGDCVNLLGQISVAAGQAAVAATTIHNDLL